jgi:hypothetical protein
VDAPGIDDITGGGDRPPACSGLNRHGAQSQQPLARVVGGMLTSAVLILVLLPVLFEWLHASDTRSPQSDDKPEQEPGDDITVMVN